MEDVRSSSRLLQVHGLPTVEADGMRLIAHLHIRRPCSRYQRHMSSQQYRSHVVIRPQALYVGINAREEQSVFLRVSTRFCAALFDSSLSQQLFHTHTRTLKRRVPHNNNISLCTGSSLRNESFFETQWTPALHTRARMHAGRAGLSRVYTAYDMIVQHVRCAVALTF